MNLDQLLKILTILNTLEPIAANAVLQFIQKLDGKSTEEILQESDTIWQNVLDTAKQQGATGQQTKKKS